MKSFNFLDNLLNRFPILLQGARFVAIGAINTSLDFLILNGIAKGLGISVGGQLGLVNIVSAGLAIVQSYFWNHSWAFSARRSGASVVVEFLQLLAVGGLGVLAVLAVVLGAQRAAPAGFYFLILLGFLIAEGGLWYVFKLSFEAVNDTAGQFIMFVIISIIGLVINSLLVVWFSRSAFASHAVAPDQVKNVAKLGATVISLIWNFLGYRLLVFKKKA